MRVVQVDFFPFKKMSEAETKRVVDDFKRSHGAGVFVTIHAVVEPLPVVDCATIKARLARQMDWLYMVGYPPFTRVVRCKVTRSSYEIGHPTHIGTVEHVE